MRKQKPSRAALTAWAIAACAALTPLLAQTTFASSNDPSAAVAVRRPDPASAVVRITQRPARAGYAALSEEVVLRDERTGVAYRPRARRRSVSAAGFVETELEFALPDLAGAPGEVLATLVDAHAPGRGLFVAGIAIAN